MAFNWGDVGSGAAVGAGAGFMAGGPWGALAGGAIGGLGGAASSWLSGDDEQDDFTPEFLRNPEYAEATGARGMWWDKLQEWEDEPGYGAIAPNWQDIWKRAQDKVRHHYWGGPGGQPGVSDKVKASAARRGVSDSPALESELTHMGYQEGAELKDIETEQSIQETLFSEKGRQNWMSQLMGLSKMRVPGRWNTPGQETAEEGFDWGGLIGKLGTAVISRAGTTI